jgi:signal transduction histidine kinase/CheY-like chemotaxis protein
MSSNSQDKSNSNLSPFAADPQQFQHILDAMDDGVIVIDANKHVVLANATGRNYLRELAGISPGERLRRLGVHPIDGLLQMFKDGSHSFAIKAGRERRLFELRIQPLCAVSPSSGWVVTLRDVTQERKLQEHLQTQERMATVGQLATGIAHDFNNILSVIIMYSQMLSDDPDSPQRHHYIDTIAQQARIGAKLISQIVDFSRSAVMDRKVVALVPFLQELTQVWQRTLRENIRVQLAYTDETLSVYADPGRLQQALTNLAINARDAMPQGGILQVDLSGVSLRQGDTPPVAGMAPGRWVRIAIVDTGQGIPADALPHIFEPFFTTKAPGQGAGLGLAQVYGIVMQHRGEIAVESIPGEGTEFTLYLPATKETATALPAHQERSYPTAQPGETILVVEDDPVVQMAIANILEQLGYTVFTASNGAEALNLVSQKADAIDLILCDMMMPEMDGIDLGRALSLQDSRIKMILVTGYPLNGEGRALLEQGVFDWLEKPVTIHSIATKVRRALDS